MKVFIKVLLIGFIYNKNIEVSYDEKTDLLMRDGKIYAPISTKTNKRFLSENNNTSSNIENIINNKKKLNEEEKVECAEEMVTGGTYWLFLFIVACLTLFAGCMSGLTVGYLSVDQLTMELRLANGTEEEKRNSLKVLPVLANRHWLLCTLLLMNSFAMEALPVFLDRIFSRLTAVIISVTLLLIFGEVIPQALCTGPRQNQIAALMAPLTRFLMIISWPITFWLGKCLDIILGEQGKTRYSKKNFEALVNMHKNENLVKDAEEEEKNPYIAREEICRPTKELGFEQEQANILLSALQIRERKVEEIMIQYDKVYSIDYEDILTKDKVEEIMKKGFSRIPVYQNNDKSDLLGILRIKQLITLDLSKNQSLRDFRVKLKKPLVIPPSMSIIEVLRLIRGGKSHMCLITDEVAKLQQKLGLNRNNSVINMNLNFNKSSVDILGIITLEDLIEEIFNLEIIDEEEYEKNKIESTNKGPIIRTYSNLHIKAEQKDTEIKSKCNKIKNMINNKEQIEMKETNDNKLKENLLPK